MKPFALTVVLFFFVVLLFSCNKETANSTVVPPVVTPPTTTTTTSTTRPVFYVSGVTGSNSRTANEARNAATPWKTIQKGVSSIPGGATLIIAGGTYTEKVIVPASANGSTTTPTVIRNKAGETPILDGNNVGAQWEALFQLKNNQYVTVKGLKAQNSYWYGFASDGCQNVSVDSCATVNTRASGIYIRASSGLTITNNNIRKACQEPNRDASGNGSQECITIASSQDFVVRNNEVWDGPTFDTPGGEGIDAKGGCVNGEISGNYVHDLYELGIYVDAGSLEEYNIRVYGNRLINTGGLSVAGELGGYARDIYFYNNVVVNSRSSGVTFQSVGNGKFTNVYVVNNTFYNSGQSGFSGDVGNYSKNAGNSNLVIRNNIFFNKSANYRFSIWHDLAGPHVIGNNLYFDFKPSSNGINSFNAANLTAADVLADPQFTNVAGNDFTLKSTSPAINKGMVETLPGATTGTLGTPLFTTDFNGKARGGSWDIGAFESQ